MEPAAKKRRVAAKPLGKFTKGMKNLYKKKKQVVLTNKNLTQQIALLGAGQTAYYNLKQDVTFSNPTAGVPGILVQRLIDPNTWTALFGTPVSANEQKTVCIKNLHLQWQVRGDLPTGPTFFHFFLVSLHKGAYTYLDGGNLNPATFTEGITHTSRSGTVQLNPDFFQIHKQWKRIMSDKIEDALSPSTSNLYDNHWLWSATIPYNYIVKDKFNGWKVSIERDFPASQRRYIVGFQNNWKMLADTGAQTVMNCLYKVVY